MAIVGCIIKTQPTGPNHESPVCRVLLENAGSAVQGCLIKLLLRDCLFRRQPYHICLHVSSVSASCFLQVQTLYYLGGEAPSVANAVALEATAADAKPDTAAAGAAAGKKRQRSGRRDRKQNKKAATKAAKDGDAEDDGEGKENQPVDGTMDATAAGAADAGKGLATAAATGEAVLLQSQADNRGSSQQRVKIPDHAEKVLDFHNKTPIHEVFQFQRITGGLVRSGHYCLEYKLLPEGAALTARGQSLVVMLQVAPSPAASFSILVRASC